ncbi:hypothetical protein [Burkholderia cepacia]|uniref:hypothetical protein n=1 Tax=Burkholderia cepacia TaxID=292 RepID=UPI00075B4574|nr:hypothetical protein [Burkholderia cepacia]KVL04468.1 hypothetical protein WS93_07270 [Burkholderia cepacia]
MARRIVARARQPGDRLAGRLRDAARAERLCIHLGHGMLAVCRVTGRFRPVVADTAVLPTETGATALADQLAVLDTWLDTHPFSGAFDWIVGIDHVRYVLLPWNPRLTSDAFCRSVAAALFAQQVATDERPFADHQIQFAPLAYGRPRLAALIANATLDALTLFSTRRERRVRRIVPAFGVAWDRMLPRIQRDSGVLALIEGPRLLRVVSERGHITAFSIQPFSSAHRPALADDATWVFPAQPAIDPTGRIPLLAGYAPDDDVRLAYALCGAT